LPTLENKLALVKLVMSLVTSNSPKADQPPISGKIGNREHDERERESQYTDKRKQEERKKGTNKGGRFVLEAWNGRKLVASPKEEGRLGYRMKTEVNIPCGSDVPTSR
jgi:hypothetical protein